jgi:hypothetical protein
MKALVIFAALFAGCAHTATINTVPPGAAVYVDGDFIGNGPATLRETSSVGKRYSIRALKDGYDGAQIYAEQTAVNSDLRLWAFPLGPMVGAAAGVGLIMSGAGVPLAVAAMAAGYVPAFFQYQLQDEITLVLHPVEE